MDLQDAFAARHAEAASRLDRQQVDRAMTAYQDLVSDTTRVLGPVNPTTVQARLGLGRTCHLAGDVERALVLFESTVEYEEKRLGAAHPDVLAIRLAISEVLLATGRTDDARESLTATVRTATRDLGPDHAVTQRMRARLGALSRTEGSDTRT